MICSTIIQTTSVALLGLFATTLEAAPPVRAAAPAPRPLPAQRPLPAAPYARPAYPWGINSSYPLGYPGYGYRSSGISIGISFGTGPGYYGYGNVYGPPWSGYYSYPSLFAPSVVQPTYIVEPRVIVVPSRTADPTLLPAPAQSVPQAIDLSATLNITAPTADAEVLIDGTATKQRGASRTFQSPQLESGHNYSYEITARWMENGKPVERTRTVPVRAGDRVAVDLRIP